MSITGDGSAGDRRTAGWASIRDVPRGQSGHRDPMPHADLAMLARVAHRSVERASKPYRSRRRAVPSSPCPGSGIAGTRGKLNAQPRVGQIASKVRALPDDGTVVVAVKDQETGRWAEVEFGTGDIYLVLAMLRTARARARRRLVTPR